MKHSSQGFELKNAKFGNFMCAFSRIFLQHTITTTIRHTQMAQAANYRFEAKIACCGYHAYKNTAEDNAKEGDEGQVEIKTNKYSV